MQLTAASLKLARGFVEHRKWPAPESLRKEEYVVLIVFRTPCRHGHQAECPLGIEESGTDTEGITGARPLAGKQQLREIWHLKELVRAAQLGNEEVRLKLLLDPERVQRVAGCGQNVLHAVEHVRDRRVTHVSVEARVP